MPSSSSDSSTTSGPVAPRPPAPLYPDVPWWAVLITAFVFSVVGILVGVLALKDAKFTATGVSGLSGSSIIVDTIAYMPHILLLFGVLADMFTLDGVWSIPSLIGVLSIFANYVFQYFWKGINELVKTGEGVVTRAAGSSTTAPAATAPPAAPAAGKGIGNEKVNGMSFFRRGGKQTGGDLFLSYKSGCSIQGFETFGTSYAPQTLVVTATVFSYYCFDLIRNRGWINSIAAILAFFAAYAGEAAVIEFQNDGGCAGPDGVKTSTLSGAIKALFEGIMFGGIGYGVVQTYAPTRLPSATISPFPRKTASDLSPGPDGRMYDADGYPYVVLPNGQAVPDVSSASARAAFGQMAASATGTTASMASNCPGVSAATCSNA